MIHFVFWSRNSRELEHSRVIINCLSISIHRQIHRGTLKFEKKAEIISILRQIYRATIKFEKKPEIILILRQIHKATIKLELNRVFVDLASDFVLWHFNVVLNEFGIKLDKITV